MAKIQLFGIVMRATDKFQSPQTAQGAALLAEHPDLAPKGFPWSLGWGLLDLLHQEVARARATARYSVQTSAQLLAEHILSG